uniref:WD_REPEATS_REGION domain-containing protein n=1 Tax=Macrostomum lignano TaxID=282301 RepID=A0A1I8F675_9PLAT
PINTMEKPQIIAHVQKSLNYTLYDCKWLPGTARFAVVGSHPRGTGALQMYEIAQGDVTIKLDTEKAKSFKCCTFGASLPGRSHLATGDFNGQLHVWDVDKPELIRSRRIKEIVNTIDAVGGTVGEGAPEIATGSRDGSVRVWDPRQPNDPVACMESDDKATARDCWAVAFGDAFNSTERCLVSGYDNGDLKLFDLRAMALRWETNLKNGICGLEFDRRDIPANKLVASTLEGKFHVFDMRTQHPNKGFASLTNELINPLHLPQNRDVFMTCGGSGGLCLWQYSYPTARVAKDSDGLDYGVAGTVALLQNVTLSTQPVASFDWSPDKLGLGICASFDQCLRVLIVTKLNRL